MPENHDHPESTGGVSAASPRGTDALTETGAQTLAGAAQNPPAATQSPPTTAQNPAAAAQNPAAVAQGPPAAPPVPGATPQPKVRRRPEWVWSAPSPELPAPREGKWHAAIDGITDARALEHGGTFVGAAVRGRGHKQDALYCDDSFSFLDIGGWKVVMVSDGAGSAVFSRVGSQIVCDAVRDVFERELCAVDLSTHTLAESRLKDIQAAPAADPFLARAAAAFERAFASAYRDVKDWVNEQNRDHNEGNATRQWVEKQFRGTEKELPRVVPDRPTAPLRLLEKDCNCTLLVTAYGVIRLDKADGTQRDMALSLSCAIGDGMMVVLRSGNATPRVIALMTPDAGEFAGQTQFVDAKTTETSAIRARLKLSFLGKPTDVVAVAAMTDGVADDYYEGTLGMERLYCDLVLNGILPTNPGPQADLLIDVSEAALRSVVGDESVFEQRPADGTSRTRPVKYSQRYLELKKMSVGQLLSNADLLDLIARSEPDTAQEQSGLSPAWQADRLRDWLDTYIVIGSFDDRSLSMYMTK